MYYNARKNIWRFRETWQKPMLLLILLETGGLCTQHLDVGRTQRSRIFCSLPVPGLVESVRWQTFANWRGRVWIHFDGPLKMGPRRVLNCRQISVRVTFRRRENAVNRPLSLRPVWNSDDVQPLIKGKHSLSSPFSLL